ncbi:MAG: Na+/H+ antiporter NhaC family protein, partial [Vulcanimicrobiota bacterium]
MSIIMPIAVFVGFHLPPQTMAAALKESILLSSISGVLAGATFGDHCSPISDTTIMSSMASASDHIDHVRTQMPYAVLVGLVSISIGILPAGFGVNPWISIFFSVIALYLILNYFGKNPEEQLQIMKSSGGSDNEGSNEKTV